MDTDFDYIIIGSGFGGSVSALRLSEKGYKVLVIEKGKWYKKPEDFAKSNWKLRKWLWMPRLGFHGIMKMSFFRHISIISGAGVGGGSLVYGNTLPVPKTSFYNSGSWGKLRDWESELAPYYDKALKMLGANPNPRLYDGDIALKTLAKEEGIEEHFVPTNVAVFFGEPNKEVPDPYFGGKGPNRSGCNFCGGCMTGCRYNAKNTLDKNYLYFAQQNGVEILAEKEVFDVRPLNGTDGASGYEVKFQNSTRIRKQKKSFSTQNVIFCGGVLGTIKLLLKLKPTSLPRISDTLGENIRTNNETLLSVTTLDKSKNMSEGIAIGSLLHTDENSHLEVTRYSEGSGFWKIGFLPLSSGKNGVIRLFRVIGSFFKSPGAYFKMYFRNSWSRHTVVLLFMQSLDSTLRFKKAFGGGMVSRLSTGEKPSAEIPRSIELTRKYADIIKGKPTAFVNELVAGIPSTAHILGGAVMGKDATEGVISEDNKVFGYKNMRIIDGSMISANPGVNPSLSITAIAERAMDQIPEKEPENRDLLESDRVS